ncbi:DinB family protein, partial [bacterium]
MRVPDAKGAEPGCSRGPLIDSAAAGLPPASPRGPALTDRESLMATLESTPALLASLLREMPEELRERRPQPAKWSAHEHFCHLAAQESPMRERLERMLVADDPELAPLYPSPEEEAGALRDVDLAEARERFARERAEVVARLRALPPEGWERTGRHPERSPYTVFILARQLMLHDMLHGFRIEELRFRRDWPDEVPSVEVVVPGSRERLTPGEIG